MTKKPFIILVLALVAITARAQDNSAQSIAFPFLRLDRNPVTSAMAGAGFSSTAADPAFAAFGNPAMPVFMDNKVSAAVSYRYWSPKTLQENHITAAFAVKLAPRVAVNAGYTRGIQPPVDPETDSFHPNDNNFSLGVSFLAAEGVSLGINGHYAMQELVKGYRLQSFCADAVVQYHLENMNAALGVMSVGPQVTSKSSGSNYSLPSSIKLAGDYTFAFGPCKLLLALDADYYFKGMMAASAGANLEMYERFFLRAGGRYAADGAPLPTHAALGAGVKIGPARVDVTYLTMNKIIGNSLMGGVSVAF